MGSGAGGSGAAMGAALAGTAGAAMGLFGTGAPVDGAGAAGAFAATLTGVGAGIAAGAETAGPVFTTGWVLAAGSESLPAMAGSGGAEDFTDSDLAGSGAGVFSAGGSGAFSAMALGASDIEIETTWSFCTMAKP